MICKIVILLLIISKEAYGNKTLQEPQFSISSQSFPQGDDSLPYSNVYQDKQPNKEIPELEHNVYRQYNSNPVRLPSIQYAPLNYEVKPEKYLEEQREVKRYDSEYVPESVNLENDHHVYSTSLTKTKNKDHLEPRTLSPNENHGQNYNSFVQGNNIEILSNHYDPYPQEKYQKQSVKPEKFVYYQRPKGHISRDTSSSKKEEEQLTIEKNSMIKFMPMKFDKLAQETHLLRPKSLHDELSMESQSQTYHNARLHLNIARTYNIAKPTREPSFPYILVPQKRAPALSQAFFIPSMVDPWKTLMYPVRIQRRPKSV